MANVNSFSATPWVGVIWPRVISVQHPHSCTGRHDLGSFKAPARKTSLEFISRGGLIASTLAPTAILSIDRDNNRVSSIPAEHQHIRVEDKYFDVQAEIRTLIGGLRSLAIWLLHFKYSTY